MIVLIEAPWLAAKVAATFLVDPLEALMFSRVKVSLNQLAIVPLKIAMAGQIFLDTKSLSLQPSLSLGLAIYSFRSLTGHRHSSSAHPNVTVGPYWWFGLLFLALNTSWKVTKSSVLCITSGVILNRFRSDGLSTVARPRP